ncbi:MAG: DUF4347 domain-containing protein, partial [Beijerinckiaceae bacterium]
MFRGRKGNSTIAGTGKAPDLLAPTSDEAGPSVKPARKPRIRTLEPRMVFDAAAEDTARPVLTDAAADKLSGHDQNSPLAPVWNQLALDVHGGPESSKADVEKVLLDDAALPVAITATDAVREIIFISDDIEGWQDILADIGPLADVVVLDATRDGVKQIADALQGQHDIDAIHIISHGSSGLLNLGTAQLTQDSISSVYGMERAPIRQALSEGADILLYGCDVGAGNRGAAFIAALSAQTGADIAASDDLTGS